MRATCERLNGEKFDVETGSENIIPVIRVGDELFVLRAHVLGFIDNKCREGANGMLYHQTEAREVTSVVGGSITTDVC